MTLDEIIIAVKVRSTGLTRYAGMESPWEEVLVAEIERLRKELRIIADGFEEIDTGGQRPDGSWITEYRKRDREELCQIAAFALQETPQ